MTIQTRIPANFPIGPNRKIVLKEDGTALLHRRELRHDISFEHERATYYYWHGIKLLMIRASAKSNIPSANFFYDSYCWVGECPDQRALINPVEETPWPSDWASQFDLELSLESFPHERQKDQHIGSVTLRADGFVIAGDQVRSTLAPFDAIDCDEVSCRARAISPERKGTVPMVEIYDKRSGEVFLYRRDFDDQWRQYFVVGYRRKIRPATWLGYFTRRFRLASFSLLPR